MGDETTTPNLPSNAHNAADSPRASMASLAIYIAIFFLVWALRATVFIHVDESISSAGWKNVYSNALKFIIWVLPVFITLKTCGLKPLTYTKLTTRLDKRGFTIGTIVVVVWLSLVVVGESVLTHRNVAAMLLQRSSDWLSIFIGVFVSPIWEEILFRGFFLNRLNERLSFWSANVISALLFMLIHWPYWVSKYGFSAAVIKDSFNVFLLGCLFGWVMKKSNSLWPAIGAHIANNFLSGLIHS